MSSNNYVCTFTVSTCGENHVGNEVIGKMCKGFDRSFFENNKERFNLHNLELNGEGKSIFPDREGLDAYLAVIPNFERNVAELNAVVKRIFWDKHMFNQRTGTVQNKAARHNVIFAFPESMEKRPPVDISIYKKKLQRLREEAENFSEISELISEYHKLKNAEESNIFIVKYMDPSKLQDAEKKKLTSTEKKNIFLSAMQSEKKEKV